MKPIPALAMLLAGLLIPAIATPASAQTPLLEIDYQNATVFHVLSDGRVLLPLGAADGYVLTADGDGYGTWQAVSGSGGGLTAVSSDATLSGDGTVGSPLGVSVPLMLTGSASGGTVWGQHNNGHYGWLGSSSYGAYGRHINGHEGYLGSSSGGAYGFNANGTFGYLGSSVYGAFGRHDNNNNYGYLGSSAYGAYGFNANGHYGYLGSSSFSVLGFNANGHYGYLGSSVYAAAGIHNTGHYGYLGSSVYGAYGKHTASTNLGALGHAEYGVYGFAPPNDHAGWFNGRVHITGQLTGGSAAFKVDHPLDPANQYLAHSVVESPDMMNVYNGNVTLDATGEAVVALPAYFEALNRDFRYQLTAIGAPGPNLYIAEKITGNRFKISGGQAGVEVSWQVTGIRQDPWAEAHRIVVEEDKPTEERGYYLHPGLYGQPEERSVEWGRDPEGMRAMQEMPQQIEAERRRMQEEQQQIEQEHARLEAEREQMQVERAQRPPRPDPEP